MNSVRLRLAAFALVVLAALGAGAAIGAAVGPIDVGDDPAEQPPVDHRMERSP